MSWWRYNLIETDSFKISVYHVAIVVALFLGAYLLNRFIRSILMRRAKNERKANEGRYFAIAQILKYVVYTVAIFFALESTGIDLTLFKAGSAALLVGLGFGLQHTFNDFVSGIIILFEGTLHIGNIVEIQTIVGRVKHIGLRTSRIETRDGVTIIVPNSKMVMDNVVNWSHQSVDRTRFNIRMNIQFGADVQMVKNILLDCAQRHKDVVDKPAPKVRLYDFSDSGYVFDLLFWTNNMFFVETVKSDLRFDILAEFEKSGISISYPHREIKIVKEDS